MITTAINAIYRWPRSILEEVILSKKSRNMTSSGSKVVLTDHFYMIIRICLKKNLKFLCIKNVSNEIQQFKKKCLHS